VGQTPTAAVSGWVRFIEVPAHHTSRRKTTRWNVFGTEAVLGQVMWATHWRRYAFFPVPNTVFDAACLREIADFCASQTEHRKAARVGEK
jgi:hypothetical protein